MVLLCGALIRASLLAMRRPFWTGSSPRQWFRYFRTSPSRLSKQEESQHAVQNITPKRTWRKWSANDLERLAHLHAEGITYIEISSILGRSVLAVHSAAKNHGMATSRRPFTSSEDTLIRAAGTADTADRWRNLQQSMPDRSLHSLSGRYNKLLATTAANETSQSLNLPTTRKPQVPFSIAEDEKIKKLRGQGMGWTEITNNLPGRTSSAVLYRYQRIVPREYWVVVKRPRSWPQDAKDRLRRLVDAGCYSAADLAAELQRPLSSVYSQLRVIRGAGERALGPPQLRKTWSKQAVKMLIDMDRSKQFTFQEIAHKLGWSEGAVLSKLSKLGCKREGGRKFWSKKEVELLLEMDASKQYKQSEMATTLGRSVSAVRLKLAKPRVRTSKRRHPPKA